MIISNDVLRLWAAESDNDSIRAVAAELIAARAKIAEMEKVVDTLDGHALRNKLTPWYYQHNGVIQRRHECDIKIRKDAREYWCEGDFLSHTARYLIEYRKAHPMPLAEAPEVTEMLARLRNAPPKPEAAQEPT